MTVQLNHTIVAAHDKQASARFLADLLGLEVSEPYGPFVPVAIPNGVTLDYLDAQGRSPRSTTRSWSPRTSSTRSSPASARPV